ncbi:CLUMA_CG011824, isoform A [Clunio marinus]|uniref:Replication factor C subunit 1 n=1 Tax=Clunio marinus TaxID=568069 RepID=A0A1J1IE35_9DIPT|nr:CLUMA_CG011824, isoform A [Clunio marinus]
MSKDIRSFFKIADKSSKITFDSKQKRKAEKIDSSDDEKRTAGSVKSKDSKKKRRIIDSDDDELATKVNSSLPAKKDKKSSTKNGNKLIEVDVFSMFGSEPVKRKERPKAETVSQNTSVVAVDVDDDEADLELNASLIAAEIERKESTKKSPNKETKKTPSKTKRESVEHNEINLVSPSPKKPKLSSLLSKEDKVASSSHEVPEKTKISSPSPKKIKETPPIKKKTSAKKEKKSKETTFEDDEARHERKQLTAILYQKFMNRTSVINHGCKEIPDGKTDCLKGHQFVITGILESMERDEAVDLIKKCGGIVVSGLSKKVTHIIVGEEAGPAKIAKAKDMGIKEMTEDDLLSLIRKKSGLPDVSTKQENIQKDSPGKENREIKLEKEDVKPIASTQVKQQPQAVQPNKIASKNLDDFSFVDKYKPTSVTQIIGQQGSSGNAQKLINWLTKWHSNNDGKKKHVKPSPWARDNDGSAFKAALLSGPPGVGKTTTAHIVARELMFDIVEFNASDTRSKKLLKEEVSSLLSNKSLAGYLNGSDSKVSSRHVLIMDEVDGMAGNEDRGGIAELISLIKESHIPIICMCNDRNHSKIRSLANHCFDLRFNKPSVNQIRSAMMSICFKENIKLEAGAIDSIISGTGNDIRQTLNHLALYSASKGATIGAGDAKKNAEMSEKDIKMGPFEAIRKVFSADEHKKMSFNDKSDLFFHDYNLMPLFVQENYLHVKPNCEKTEILNRVALAADSLSIGDLVEKKIRSNMAWSLLPTQAVFSSVLPGEYMEGTFASAVNFPAWLGKTSRSNKRKRMAQEVHDHTRSVTSGSRLSVRLDYAQFLVQAIVRPLKEKGLEGVHESLEVIKEYRLLREDIESLLELTSWPKMKNPWDSIDSKVKAALTRAYNKEVQPYAYSAQTGVKKKNVRATEAEGFDYDEDAAALEQSDEEDDSLEKNTMIKIKKPSMAKDTKSGSSKPSTSAKASSSKSKGGKSKKGN